MPLAPAFPAFPGGDRWGARALGTDREDYGGPAAIPTANQLWRLATDGRLRAESGEETITYPQGMVGAPRSILNSWESKEAAARRQRERDAKVAGDVVLLECDKCGVGSGEQCHTASGWVAERPRAGRQREAEARVDQRLGYLGPTRWRCRGPERSPGPRLPFSGVPSRLRAVGFPLPSGTWLRSLSGHAAAVVAAVLREQPDSVAHFADLDNDHRVDPDLRRALHSTGDHTTSES